MPGFEPPLGDPSTVGGNVKAPGVPPQAVQAAAEAMEAEDCNRTYLTFPAMAEVAATAAAPFIAEHIARLIEGKAAALLDEGRRTGPCVDFDEHDCHSAAVEATSRRYAQIARDAFSAEPSPATTPQTAPQSTETGRDAVSRLLGSTDDPTTVETLTALREWYAQTIARALRDATLGGLQPTAASGVTPDAYRVAAAVLAVRDDKLGSALQRAEQAEAEAADLRAEVKQTRLTVRATHGLYRSAEGDVTRVHQLAERWKHVSDRKDGPLRELLAALDVPADGEQTDPANPEEGDR